MKSAWEKATMKSSPFFQTGEKQSKMTRFNETGEAIPFELRPARQCAIEVGVGQSNTFKTKSRG